MPKKLKKIEDLDFLENIELHESKKKSFKTIKLDSWIFWDGHDEELILPIHYAAAKANTEGIRWILKKFKKPQDYYDIQTKKGGLAPIHFSVLFSNFETLKELIEKGAKIDIQDNNYGYSPLHYACRYSVRGAIRILLSSYVDTSSRDKSGKTPKDVAKCDGRRDIVMMLEDPNGADEFKGTMETFRRKTEQWLEDMDERVTMLSSSLSLNSRASTIRNRLSMASSMSRTDESGLASEYHYDEAIFLRELYDLFKENMTDAYNIAGSLYARGCVTMNFKNQIKEEKTSMQMNEMLIDKVIMGNKKMFDVFLKRLHETKQQHLANLLEQKMLVNTHVNSMLSTQSLNQESQSDYEKTLDDEYPHNLLSEEIDPKAMHHNHGTDFTARSRSKGNIQGSQIDSRQHNTSIEKRNKGRQSVGQPVDGFTQPKSTEKYLNDLLRYGGSHQHNNFNTEITTTSEHMYENPQQSSNGQKFVQGNSNANIFNEDKYGQKIGNPPELQTQTNRKTTDNPNYVVSITYDRSNNKRITTQKVISNNSDKEKGAYPQNITCITSKGTPLQHTQPDLRQTVHGTRMQSNQNSFSQMKLGLAKSHEHLHNLNKLPRWNMQGNMNDDYRSSYHESPDFNNSNEISSNNLDPIWTNPQRHRLMNLGTKPKHSTKADRCIPPL